MLNPVLVIIGANVFMFIAVTVSPQLVLDLGMWSPVEIFTQYPWGVFTSMFTHEQFYHLFANMFTLFFFGTFLLRLVKEKWFWLIYIGGGLLGNLLFLGFETMLNPDSAALAIGASGAIFALGGALAVLMPNLRVFVFPIPVPMPLWVAVVGGFLIMSFLPGIAWSAHLGGLIFGAACGLILKRRGRTYY